MKKTFKKLIAIVMATTTMAVGFGGMSVSAVSETASWSARYVNVHGAPTSESRTGSATMKASSEVYTGKVNTMSDITNRSLTLSSTTHTMSTGSIVYNNTGSRRWYISGEIKDVTYEMVAYTSQIVRVCYHYEACIVKCSIAALYFDYSEEIEYEKKDFTVYICFIVVFNCLQ